MGYKVIIVIATTILCLTGLLLGYVLSQLVLGFLNLNLVTFLGTFSLIVIFATVYYVLFWEFRRQQSQSLAGVAQFPEDETAVDRSNSQIKRRLLALLSGDVNAAERLIEQAKENYPGNPEHWYWERVLNDLERDRR
jgi:uncharacterized protein HemY